MNREQKLEADVDRLRNAIRQHRDEHGDDRCWMDDDRLYAVLGDGIKCDRRVGDKAAMIENCRRFIERRCEAGGWLSYAEVERRVETAEAQVNALSGVLANIADTCRSRGFAAGRPIDERVIAMAQDRDAWNNYFHAANKERLEGPSRETFLAAARYEKVRRLNPRDLYRLADLNLAGENFDEMVDKL